MNTFISKAKKAAGRVAGALGSLYRKNFVPKVILTAAAVVVAVGLCVMIPVLGIHRSPLPQREFAPLAARGEQIAKEEGRVRIAENAGKELYLDTETMVVTLKDKKTGLTWSSAVEGTQSASELALLSLTYLGDDNNLYEWNSYSNCTALGSYELYRIENGVSMRLNFNEGEQNRFYEYFPRRMSVERYEEFFVGGLERLRDEGTISDTEYDRYMTTMKLIYKRSTEDNCYIVTYPGTPPNSAVNQMTKVARLLNYTSDMLVDDAAKFGLTVTFTVPAEFNLTVEITLDGDELVARIPTWEAESVNEYYVIQNIKVLPNFGAVTAKQVPDGGYLFVPDGAGALIEMNQYNAAYSEYVRPIYDNDFYKDYYFAPEYSEELAMPVFGMTCGKGSNATSGFLGIIEQGAETSYIHTKVAGTGTEGMEYNKIFPSFDVTQYSKVKVEGPYSDTETTYMVQTKPMEIDYTVRYVPYNGNVTYFEMARTYRDYLIAHDSRLKEVSYTDKERIYLEVIGSLTLTERFAGIPYDSPYSMTTYRELTEILEDLSDLDLAVSYRGVFNKGLKNSLSRTAKLASVNGSREELDRLLAYGEEADVPIYLGTDVSRVYASGSGYMAALHAVKDYSDYIFKDYRYVPSLGILYGYYDSNAISYSLVSPWYLPGIAEGFSESAGGYDRLFLEDLPGMVYADYNNSQMVSIYDADQVLQEAMAVLSDGRKTALEDPWMKNIGYGELAADISRESSDYGTFVLTVPFRQLVMNGLIAMTTESVNMSSQSKDYYILQYVELGCYPKFTVSAKSVDELRGSQFSYLYSMEYAQLEDTIREVAAACREAGDIIGTNEIVRHRRIRNNVFETEYASGVKAVVNYNPYDVELNDGTKIAGMGYVFR